MTREKEAFQPALHVWPGTIIDVDPSLVTIKLARISQYETGEEFTVRCNQVTALAITLSERKKKGPEVFDFSDTTKFKKIGENSYEQITRGIHDAEEE